MHEKLRQAVSTVVGSEARYDDRLALPGFHVHLRDPEQVIPPASIHFDLQFELIDWNQLGVADGREQLSLTLAIALPAEGGGLMVWNINRMDIEAMTDEARRPHGAPTATPAAIPNPRTPPRSTRADQRPDGAGSRPGSRPTSASPCSTRPPVDDSGLHRLVAARFTETLTDFPTPLVMTTS